MKFAKKIPIIWFVIILLSNSYSQESKSKIDLLSEKRQVALEMAKVRLKLINDNDELRETHERIIKLQKSLMRKLDSQPEMQFLINKQQRIEKQLEGMK